MRGALIGAMLTVWLGVAPGAGAQSYPDPYWGQYPGQYPPATPTYGYPDPYAGQYTGQYPGQYPTPTYGYPGGYLGGPTGYYSGYGYPGYGPAASTYATPYYGYPGSGGGQYTYGTPYFDYASYYGNPSAGYAGGYGAPSTYGYSSGYPQPSYGSTYNPYQYQYPGYSGYSPYTSQSYAGYVPPPAPLGSLVSPYSQYPGYSQYSGYSTGQYPAYTTGQYPAYGTGTGAFQLTATQSGANMAILSWNVVPGAGTYQIYQGLNGQPMTPVTTANTTSTSVPMGAGGSYVFQVAAIGPNGFEMGRSNYSQPLVAGTGYPGAYPPPYPGAYGAVGSVSPSSSTVVAAQSFVSGTYGTQITVTVRDMTGRGLAGQVVTVTPTRFTDSATPVSGNGMTDGGGTAFFTVRGTPGQATFTTVAGGVALAPVTITFQ
jgi:hypothetical protein